MSEASPQKLSGLPGIDIQAGLQVAMQDEDFYRGLLVKFRDKYGEFAQQLQAAHEAGGGGLVEQAHTLKGVAGNLGMTTLHDAAAALEQAAREDSVDVSGLLETTQTELGTVLGGLEAL